MIGDMPECNPAADGTKWPRSCPIAFREADLAYRRSAKIQTRVINTSGIASELPRLSPAQAQDRQNASPPPPEHWLL